MNRLALAALLAAPLACSGADRPPPDAPARTSAPAIAVVGGTVIAAPGSEPIRDGVVVIRGGRIAAVGARGSTAVPEGATVIDATGGTVLAGFWNCHVHFSQPVWSGAASAPLDRLRGALEQTFTRWGFAHVVDTGSNPADTVAVRRRIEAGELAGPSIITAGIPLAPVKGTPIYVREAGFQLPEPASPAQARAIVGEIAGQGVDAIKIFAASFIGRGQKPPVMAADVIAAVVDEAHRRKLLVFAHPTNLPGLSAAVDGGVDVVLHTSPDGGPWPEGTAQRLVSRKVALVPTLKLWDWELSRKNVPAAALQNFQRTAVEQLRSFARAGGAVLFGTDVGYMSDPDTADELRHMTEAGMDFPALLTSLTTAPAARFGATRTGSLEPGLDADLVIVDGDPAADPMALSRVRLTMRRGAILWRAGR
jgi:imidazolonepropionase-like amidohydrolase